MKLGKILRKSIAMDFYIYSLVTVYVVVLLDNPSYTAQSWGGDC